MSDVSGLYGVSGIFTISYGQTIIWIAYTLLHWHDPPFYSGSKIRKVGVLARGLFQFLIFLSLGYCF
jgi:hypothetical protein